MLASGAAGQRSKGATRTPLHPWVVRSRGGRPNGHRSRHPGRDRSLLDERGDVDRRRLDRGPVGPRHRRGPVTPAVSPRPGCDSQPPRSRSGRQSDPNFPDPYGSSRPRLSKVRQGRADGVVKRSCFGLPAPSAGCLLREGVGSHGGSFDRDHDLPTVHGTHRRRFPDRTDFLDLRSPRPRDGGRPPANRGPDGSRSRRGLPRRTPEDAPEARPGRSPVTPRTVETPDRRGRVGGTQTFIAATGIPGTSP